MEIALRPFFRRRYLLSKSERCFYKVLRSVVAPNPVLAKVRIADLIDADKRHHLWRSNFRRICPRHVDFVVWAAALSPVIAIELDDSSHQRSDRQARDRDVDRIFQLAELPILRVAAHRDYWVEDVEN